MSAQDICECGHPRVDHDKSGCHNYMGEYGMVTNINLYFVPCQNSCKGFIENKK